VVLEILETVSVDARIVRRRRQLQRMGFRLALDDFCAFRDDYDALLPWVDIVKIDILGVEEMSLGGLVERLRPYRARLLAEKVDTRERANLCARLGFDLFQGFFFARPSPLAG
jgi:EAL and modified HD-GYP domain-containing signal transduction protein